MHKITLNKKQAIKFLEAIDNPPKILSITTPVFKLRIGKYIFSIERKL